MARGVWSERGSCLDRKRSGRRKAVLEVEKWAEIRRMSRVERLSQREISKRTGVNRRTVKRALDSTRPPNYNPRRGRPSKLDPHRAEVERLLGESPTLSGVRVLEEIRASGYQGGKSILTELLAELRPRYQPPPRTFQRSDYRPGELAQFDLMELREPGPGRLGPDPQGLSADLGAAVFEDACRGPDLLQALRRHQLGHEPVSDPAWRPAREGRGRP